MGRLDKSNKELKDTGSGKRRWHNKDPQPASTESAIPQDPRQDLSPTPSPAMMPKKIQAQDYHKKKGKKPYKPKHKKEWKDRRNSKNTTTNGQAKLHITQMSDGDKDTLTKRISELSTQYLKLTHHYLERKEEKQFSWMAREIKEMISNPENYSIIEFSALNRNYDPDIDLENPPNRKDHFRRVLIESKATVMAKVKEDSPIQECHMKISLDLDTGVVVTGYPNAVGDTHKTLNMDLYTEELKVPQDFGTPEENPQGNGNNKPTGRFRSRAGKKK